MLEAEMGHVVAERKQEMIIAVMPCAEEFAGLGHEIDHSLLNLGAHVERDRTVGDHVNLVMNGLAGRSDVDDAVVLTGDDGRIDQQLQRNGLERNLISGLIRYRKRSAELPFIGKDEFRFV